ncbi:hypothetical protein D3C81_1525920 [compost metagenome]
MAAPPGRLGHVAAHRCRLRCRRRRALDRYRIHMSPGGVCHHRPGYRQRRLPGPRHWSQTDGAGARGLHATNRHPQRHIGRCSAVHQPGICRVRSYPTTSGPGTSQRYPCPASERTFSPFDRVRSGAPTRTGQRRQRTGPGSRTQRIARCHRARRRYRARRSAVRLRDPALLRPRLLCRPGHRADG